MTRQKEFDRDEVLHRAMEVFWTRGYEGASIQDLVKHMGINRQSIYDTFGDKHTLFLQALDRYREIQSRKIFEVLERPGSMKKKSAPVIRRNGPSDGFCDSDRRRA